jgi:hypothetical protein
MNPEDQRRAVVLMHVARSNGLLPLIVLVLRGWRYQVERGRLWVRPPPATLRVPLLIG